MSSVETRVLQYKTLADKWSKQTGVPAALILATIEQESGGNPSATRHEPGFLRRHAKGCNQLAESAHVSPEAVATSYGLMQLLLSTAWGYMSKDDRAKPVEALLDVERNIRYGAAHLAALSLTHHGTRAIAGAYNGGGETSQYARNIEALERKYEELIN